MVGREEMAALRYLHASYNAAAMAMLFYMLVLGLRIRRARMTGARDPGAVRRHRKIGTPLAFLAMAGFPMGAAIVYADYGHMLEYPIHFANGATIALLTMTTFLVSRRIKAGRSALRTLHLVLGVTIVCLYLLQAFIGLGALL